MSVREEVLRSCLEVAVPMRLLELAAMPPVVRAATIEEWRRTAVEPIASRGDILQYGSRKRGEAGEVFNHLARGLAALAHAPGGVRFAGLHFRVTTDPT